MLENQNHIFEETKIKLKYGDTFWKLAEETYHLTGAKQMEAVKAILEANHLKAHIGRHNGKRELISETYYANKTYVLPSQSDIHNFARAFDSSHYGHRFKSYHIKDLKSPNITEQLFANNISAFTSTLFSNPAKLSVHTNEIKKQEHHNTNTMVETAIDILALTSTTMLSRSLPLFSRAPRYTLVADVIGTGLFKAALGWSIDKAHKRNAAHDIVSGAGLGLLVNQTELLGSEVNRGFDWLNSKAIFNNKLNSLIGNNIFRSTLTHSITNTAFGGGAPLIEDLIDGKLPNSGTVNRMKSGMLWGLGTGSILGSIGALEYIEPKASPKISEEVSSQNNPENTNIPSTPNPSGQLTAIAADNITQHHSIENNSWLSKFSDEHKGSIQKLLNEFETSISHFKNQLAEREREITELNKQLQEAIDTNHKQLALQLETNIKKLTQRAELLKTEIAKLEDERTRAIDNIRKASDLYSNKKSTSNSSNDTKIPPSSETVGNSKELQQLTETANRMEKEADGFDEISKNLEKEANLNRFTGQVKRAEELEIKAKKTREASEIRRRQARDLRNQTTSNNSHTNSVKSANSKANNDPLLIEDGASSSINSTYSKPPSSSDKGVKPTSHKSTHSWLIDEITRGITLSQTDKGKIKASK